MNYSVLMSVYYKETTDALHASIESMLSQTQAPEQIVIVCDGPLPDGLNEVISKFERLHPDLFTIVRLPENCGIGRAANAGIRQCRNDIVAKMDADDISKDDRCERQLKLFAENPELSIVGGYLAEFMDTPDNVVAKRKVPLDHDDIVQYAKRRMPFNNQTVMYRKSAVLAVGGYSDLRRCEDYDLYVRMLKDGFLARNIDKVLVSFRLDKEAYRRRGSWGNFKGFVKVRWRIHRSGFSSFLDFLIPLIGQVILSLSPYKLKNWLYLKYMRQQV